MSTFETMAAARADGAVLRRRSVVRIAPVLPAIGLGLTGLLLALPVLLLTAPFWLVGTLTSWLAGLLEHRPRPWHALVEFDPRLGWKPRANVDTWAGDLNQDTFRIRTDADGWRGRARLEAADVLVFGDSFAQGFGVDDRHFFADLPKKIEVKAVGCAGYNLVQSLRWMEEYACHLEGRLVVWLVYLGNDLEDDLNPAVGRYRQPFVRSPDGGLTWSVADRHVRPDAWTASTQEASVPGYVQLCRGGSQAWRALRALDFLVSRAWELCEAHGAKLVIATVPELSPVARKEVERALTDGGRGAFDERRLERDVARVCRRHGVPVVRLRECLDVADYLTHDYHWNRRGHRKVASVLEDLHSRFRAGLDLVPHTADGLASSDLASSERREPRRVARVGTRMPARHGGI